MAGPRRGKVAGQQNGGGPTFDEPHTTVVSKPGDRTSITTAAATREEQEIKGAMIMARQFPRSEDGARQKLLIAASRRLFAEECTYSFPRGNTTVMGPSIKMAREFARLWGNIRFGCKIVADDEDSRSIVGWAWDLEANTYEETPDTFRKLVQRAGGQWIVPDERDLRELTLRRSAICVRNCIIHLMPSDLLADIIDKAEATIRTKAADVDAHRKDIIDGFTLLNVPIAELEELIGHQLGACSPKELDRLKSIWKTIKAGDAAWVDYYRKQDAVVPSAGKAASFAGAKGSETDRTDDKRACLPTHLRPMKDDMRSIVTYLLALIPTVGPTDLDAIASALPGLKLGADQMAVINAIAQARSEIPVDGTAAKTKSGPYPADVLTTLDNIAAAKTELAVLTCQQAWLAIKGQDGNREYDAEVKAAIHARMKEVK